MAASEGKIMNPDVGLFVALQFKTFLTDDLQA